MKPRTLAPLLLLALAWPAHSPAQTAADGPLGDLHLARQGGFAHYASTDPTGGNDDWRPIAPGETLVLVDHTGAGVVRRWWLTVAPRNIVEIQRHLIVRCYWDGEVTPSVEVPLTDFFGMGFGVWKDFVSLPVNMTSGGYNTYWPMPFHRSARITVENTSTVPVTHFYYNIGIRTYDALPADALYFHAQFRQARTRRHQPITILEATGRGHYVGTLLSMQPERGSHLGYLEGDERIFIDGDMTARLVGTGTEDYFSAGWYYDTGEYSAPYHGAPLKDDAHGRVSTYRWHIEDPIPFSERFVFEIEHGGTNDTPGVDYASVAFWYQTHPHATFPPLPRRLVPRSQASVPSIEGESLLARARGTGGKLLVQDMSELKGSWSGDAHLWWVEARPGDRLTLPLEAPADGTYELVGFFTRAQDYGIIRLHVNGQPLGVLMDGLGPQPEPTGPLYLGVASLRAGTNELVVELTCDRRATATATWSASTASAFSPRESQDSQSCHDAMTDRRTFGGSPDPRIPCYPCAPTAQLEEDGMATWQFRGGRGPMWRVAAAALVCAMTFGAAPALLAQAKPKPAAKPAAGAAPEIIVGGIRVVGPGYGNNRSEVRPFMEEPGTAVALIIKMPEGAGIIDLDEDDCTLDALSDDAGTDLLEHGEYGSFPKTSEDGTVGMIEIKSNLRPAAGAKAIVAEGTLVFTSSTGVKPVKVAKVKFENGFAMKVGDGTISFTEISTEGENPSFSLAMTRAQLRGIKDVRFFDAKGEAIPAQRSSSGYFNDEASISYSLESKGTPVSVEFDLWQDLKTEKVPYKASATLSLK